MIVVLMGAAGCGKTTVGQRLAADLGWAFFDADDFHPAASVARMAAGQPLDDAGRGPWLARLRRLIDELHATDTSAVIACSALRRSYRERLLSGCDDAALVHLKAGRQLLRERLRARAGHFFPASLLDSQLATLEEPDDAITVSAQLPIEAIVGHIRAALAR